ncbi:MULTISPECIES: 50S ribosomal protein L25/general stress protein Ctc [Priestia]|uniref:50S ribosomal protein L25/general stress protein Ctc n=1 Tax=Priestia TaxID=2800373 RepID=UPI000BF2CDD4|nr:MULTISPECIES: 50S ribosomal protein L25/general stress protein Ctc [Priestia]MBK0010205.1 50S ribosomal protein L25/general stress protein Ctc [Bacillus sp. S35]MCM3255860.1 50S ribosomal protein L25/general stress protein Ctc [Priestia aryabhattai]MCM3644846.1 50S ribosomal protein L25/general stress protein Ctc [Priestia aryabhattai]PFW72093.1 50S ribosomal protein L25/general stress protein Ctc [Priestia aryabhattai]UYP08021.1 50S ribosomal protein L25/general stress protein Ctc [Priesti
MSISIQANKRTDFKNSTNRKIRDEGNFPAVVYGNKTESTPIYLNSADFIKTIREAGRNGVLTLQVEKQKYSVMLHDIQTDPLKNEIVHADFQVVDMKKEIDTEVSLSLVGEAKGTKEGGVLQQSLYEISLKGLPQDIPSSIDVDVSDLGINDTITVGDIKVDKKLEITHNAEDTVASVLPPQQEEEPDSGEVQDAEGDVEATKEKDNEE